MARKKKRNSTNNKKDDNQMAKTAAPAVEYSEPPVQFAEPPVIATRLDGAGDKGDNDRRFWPADKPLPAFYRKINRQQLPCPQCRRVLLDNLSQAVVCQSSGQEVAWFYCKGCANRFCLPVRMEE